MSFTLENTTSSFDPSKQISRKRLIFTINSKNDRKRFSKFLRSKQFTIPNILIKLTCFPQVLHFQNYNSCLTDQTFNSEVSELITKLNLDGYFIVAEVVLTM